MAGFFIVRSMFFVGGMPDGAVCSSGVGVVRTRRMKEVVRRVEKVCGTYTYIANKIDPKSDG